MKISVCICIYNGDKFIKKQLETILHQSKKANEVILCDDGSKDRSVEIAEDFIRGNGLKKSWKLYINEVNKGYPGNFYHAMGLCTGDVVFLSDQDDLWTKDKIESMTKVLEQDEKIELLASRWGIIDKEDGLLKEVSRKNASSKDMLKRVLVKDILYCNDWPGMCMCYRRELGKRAVAGAGKSNIPHDILLGMLAAEQESFYCLNRVCQYHRRHEANVAMEEHRIRKLLNKERKLLEIHNYLMWLGELKAGKDLLSKESLDVLEKKFHIMEERLFNLENGRRLRIIKQYLGNREEIRLSTALCDWIICRK